MAVDASRDNVFAYSLGERIRARHRPTQRGCSVARVELEARKITAGTDVKHVSVRRATNKVNVQQGIVSCTALLVHGCSEEPALSSVLSDVLAQHHHYTSWPWLRAGDSWGGWV